LAAKVGVGTLPVMASAATVINGIESRKAIQERHMVII
jgi:hypothetical protein